MPKYTDIIPASERIVALEKEIEELEKFEGSFEDAEKRVNRHHRMLHQYNEAKDSCQILFGKLAALKCVTVKQIHDEYEMKGDD